MLDNPISFIATAKPDDARHFYQQTLGLQLVEETEWAIVFDLAGTPLRIQKVEAVPAANHTVLGWLVSDIGSVVAHLRSRGVTFQRYPQLPQDEDAVWTTPDGARIAWFSDPDGNTLSLTQAATL